MTTSSSSLILRGSALEAPGDDTKAEDEAIEFDFCFFEGSPLEEPNLFFKTNLMDSKEAWLLQNWTREVSTVAYIDKKEMKNTKLMEVGYILRTHLTYII